MRWIERVFDANTILLSEAWTTAIATPAGYVSFNPYIVSAKTTDAFPSAGFAQVALVANDFAWIQTKGIGFGLVDGSQDPIVAGSIITAGTAVAGTIEGPAAGGIDVNDLEGRCGVGMVDTGALDVVAPIIINAAGF
jgi:hypothetical protein